MVLVPAGEVTLGSTEFEDTTPMTQVSLDAFWVGKFEVTRREFAQFIKDTGFSAPSMCYHEIGYWWFEQDSPGSWNDNGINTSWYEPVSCIGYDAAVAYTKWLSQKTGKPYRLLSEAEWVYLAVNFADNTVPVCERANVADQRAESVAQTKYGTSYINLIGIEDCDDHAGTVSMVGQYQPNALGVYDLIGNVNEFVADCYRPDYSLMPDDGSAVKTPDCEAVVLRGGAWHWPAWPVNIRDAKPRDWVGVLEGFRLAMDHAPTNSHHAASAARLEQEIMQARTEQKNVPSLPETVQQLQIVQSEQQSELRWQGALLTGEQYVVLANDYMGGRFRIVDHTSTPSYPLPPQVQQAHQYVVAIQRDTLIGPYSDAIDVPADATRFPATIQAEHFSNMSNALVFPYDEHNQFVTGPLSGKGDIILHYTLMSPSQGQYEVRLVGKAGAPVSFSVQHQDGTSGTIALGDKHGFVFSAHAGEQTLILTTSSAGWQLDKLVITEVQ